MAGAFKGAADEAALQVIGDPLTTSLVMGLEVLRSLAAVETPKTQTSNSPSFRRNKPSTASHGAEGPAPSRSLAITAAYQVF